jgi:drug/metabolite transporter (DMT)-like permease
VAARRYAPEGALVLAAFLFGITFVLVGDALDDVTPAAFLVLRFALAVVVLAPVAVVSSRTAASRTAASPPRPPATPPPDRRTLVRVGAVAGVLLFGGFAAQTVGLQDTSPATSAFITGLFVIFTPFVQAVVDRAWPPASVVVCAGLAAFGLYLLTGADLGVGRGEVATLICAVMFAVWIGYQGRNATRVPPVQMAVLVVVGLPWLAVAGVGDLTATAWLAVAVTGIACSAVALTLQLWGQRRIPAPRAALILLLEPVFAGVVSVLVGERIGAIELLGAGVILVAIALAERGPRRPRGARPRAAR